RCHIDCVLQASRNGAVVLRGHEQHRTRGADRITKARPLLGRTLVEILVVHRQIAYFDNTALQRRRGLCDEGSSHFAAEGFFAKATDHDRYGGFAGHARAPAWISFTFERARLSIVPGGPVATLVPVSDSAQTNLNWATHGQITLARNATGAQLSV